MTSDQKRDLFAACLFLAMSLIAIFFLIPQGVKVPRSIKSAALSPDFWPRIIAYATALASGFLLFETLTWQQPQLEEDETEESAQYQLNTMHASLRVIAMIGALFFFYASLTTLGVVAASVVLMFSMMLFFGERKIWLIAVLSLGIPVLLYVFFRFVASVPIPLGMFGN